MKELEEAWAMRDLMDKINEIVGWINEQKKPVYMPLIKYDEEAAEMGVLQAKSDDKIPCNSSPKAYADLEKMKSEGKTCGNCAYLDADSNESCCGTSFWKISKGNVCSEWKQKEPEMKLYRSLTQKNNSDLAIQTLFVGPASLEKLNLGRYTCAIDSVDGYRVKLEKIKE